MQWNISMQLWKRQVHSFHSNQKSDNVSGPNRNSRCDNHCCEQLHLHSVMKQLIVSWLFWNIVEIILQRNQNRVTNLLISFFKPRFHFNPSEDCEGDFTTWSESFKKCIFISILKPKKPLWNTMNFETNFSVSWWNSSQIMIFRAVLTDVGSLCG